MNKGIIIKTGEKVPFSGIWSSVATKKREFYFKKGEYAPTFCTDFEKHIKWVLVEEEDHQS